MRHWLTIAAIALAFAFAAFVWPTQWTYQEATLHTINGPRQHLVRINRFTGKTYYLTQGGWASSH